MKIAGFGCAAIGLLIALVGLLAFVAAIAGFVNYSEVGTAYVAGGSLCCTAFIPFLVGVALIVMGRKSDAE